MYVKNNLQEGINRQTLSKYQLIWNEDLPSKYLICCVILHYIQKNWYKVSLLLQEKLNKLYIDIVDFIIYAFCDKNLWKRYYHNSHM